MDGENKKIEMFFFVFVFFVNTHFLNASIFGKICTVSCFLTHFFAIYLSNKISIVKQCLQNINSISFITLPLLFFFFFFVFLLILVFATFLLEYTFGTVFFREWLCHFLIWSEMILRR